MAGLAQEAELHRVVVQAPVIGAFSALLAGEVIDRQHRTIVAIGRSSPDPSERPRLVGAGGRVESVGLREAIKFLPFGLREGGLGA